MTQRGVDGEALPPRWGRLRRWALWLGLLVLVGAAAAWAPRALYLLSHESTDDAYVHGASIVPILPQVQGRVVEVAVQEDQAVTAGALLVRIEDADYAARLRQAEGEVAQRQAELAQARILLERTRSLAARKVVDPERLDEVQHAADASAAALAQAEASRDLARIDLARTRITAPIGGRVTRKNVSVGQVVSPGDALFALVDLQDVWVMANFKETQIGGMRPGQPVDIEVDAYPDRTFHGHVDGFQPGTGSVFSLLPPENATGNFVKVVQRVPVRIAIDTPFDPEHPLYPGLSVTPYVDTRAPGRPPSAHADAEP